jgi:hypothetical protein
VRSGRPKIYYSIMKSDGHEGLTLGMLYTFIVLSVLIAARRGNSLTRNIYDCSWLQRRPTMQDSFEKWANYSSDQKPFRVLHIYAGMMIQATITPERPDSGYNELLTSSCMTHLHKCQWASLLEHCARKSIGMRTSQWGFTRLSVTRVLGGRSW